MNDVCFVYKNKCHPVSQTYADVINAVPCKVTGFLDALWRGMQEPTYKYYFIESVMSMIVPITKRMRGKKVKIIFRGNDGLFGERTNAYLWTKNPVKKLFLLFLIKNMDGIIVESTMTKDHAKQWTKVPIEICESYVENKKALEEIKPNLQTRKFLFIGEYRPPTDHKNIAFLLEVFRNLPEYELIIIGKNTKKLESKAPKNVTVLNFVEDKNQWYKKCSYYIHFPKYETGPITILEAMAAGIIPISNAHAGHASYIEKIASDLVLTGTETAEQAAEKIKKIAEKPLPWKQKIAETFKKNAQFHWNKEQQKHTFKSAWHAVITEIEQK